MVTPVSHIALKSWVTIHVVDKAYDSPVYKVDLMLPNGVGFLGVNVSKAENIQGADLLIGWT